MKKLFTLVLLGMMVVGITGCKEEEPTAEGMMKQADKAASQAPKDHPAH